MVKLTDIAASMANKLGISKAEADKFVASMVDVMNDALHYEKPLKVKGLGTFKVTSVNARESVNVNTGERILIDGREKISFTPDASMRDLVNRPFAQFETVVVKEGVNFDEIDRRYADNDSQTDADDSVQPVHKEAVSESAEPKEEVVELQKESIEPQEEVVASQEKVVEHLEDAVTLQEEVVAPQDDAVKHPIEELVEPAEAPIEPINELAEPINEVDKSKEEAVEPVEKPVETQDEPIETSEEKMDLMVEVAEPSAEDDVPTEAVSETSEVDSQRLMPLVEIVGDEENSPAESNEQDKNITKLNDTEQMSEIDESVVKYDEYGYPVYPEKAVKKLKKKLTNKERLVKGLVAGMVCLLALRVLLPVQEDSGARPTHRKSCSSNHGKRCRQAEARCSASGCGQCSSNPVERFFDPCRC